MSLQFLLDGLISGAMIGLGAIGVTLTYSILRFSNFAHGDLMAWGAYAALVAVGVVGGLAGQFDAFRGYVGAVALAIVVQNAVSLGIGYGTGRGLRLPEPGVRAMTFELGVRNTGLALVLALGFFGDLGGVAFVAALWGLWDVTTGLVLSTWWKRATGRAAPAGSPGSPAAR